MAELKPIEVVMRIDFASSNGIEVIAHAERVCELVRCKDCMYMTEDRYTDGNVPCYICSEWDKGTEYGGFCHLGERKETKNE